jgi:hypothetical protein
MYKTNELAKAFVFVIALLAAGASLAWLAYFTHAYWSLFISIPLLFLVGFIIAVKSTVSIRCSNCGKEIGVTSGGIWSVWFPVKPERCQWCGNKSV